MKPGRHVLGIKYGHRWHAGKSNASDTLCRPRAALCRLAIKHLLKSLPCKDPLARHPMEFVLAYKQGRPCTHRAKVAEAIAHIAAVCEVGGQVPGNKELREP